MFVSQIRERAQKREAEELAADALAWLGRELRFEAWLDALSTGEETAVRAAEG
jgi:hypothetical protein